MAGPVPHRPAGRSVIGLVCVDCVLRLDLSGALGDAGYATVDVPTTDPRAAVQDNDRLKAIVIEFTGGPSERAIAREAMRRSIPVVLVTGLDSVGTEAPELAKCARIGKPFRMRQLIKAVGRLG